jgi:3-keto-5-aminohexanoate cleavage enzyme
MQKLIINASICGSAMRKEQNPAIPYTIEELTREAVSAHQAGAAIIHIHVRNDDGTPSHDQSRFQAAAESILDACPGVILQPSTAGEPGMTDEERLRTNLLTPPTEYSSITCGSFNLGGDEIFANTDQTIRYFAAFMREHKIRPELEAFDKGMIDIALRHARQGIFDEPLHFNLLLGLQISATARDLAYMVDSLPSDASWCATGIGRSAFDIAALSIVMGGNVRIGFEDTQYLSRGVKAKSNGELVAKVADMAKAYGRGIATPDEAREILRIGR